MLKEIDASHHQKKKLIKAIQDESVMFVDDNGDLVINPKTYPGFVKYTGHDPLKAIMGIDDIADDVDYLVIR